MRHPTFLLTALLTTPFSALSAPQAPPAFPPTPPPEPAHMDLECDYEPYYGPPLRESSCNTVLKRGFEHVFSTMDYQLTHLTGQGPTFIKCPFKFDDGNCQMIIDYEEKEFPSSLFPPNVVKAGEALIRHCVKARSKQGGYFFPVDGNDSATLWLGPMGISDLEEIGGLGGRRNASASTKPVADYSQDGVAVA